MQCPSCFAEIPDDSYTCPECGVTVEGSQSLPPGAAPYSSAQEPHGSRQSSDDFFSVFFRPYKGQDSLKKIFTMGLWGMIPLVGALIVNGYLVEYCRQILKGEDPRELPPTNDIGGMMMPGVMLSLAASIYLLVLMGIAGVVSLPFIGGIVAALKSLEGNVNGDAIGGLACGAMLIPLLIIFILSVIFGFIGPMITIFYSRSLNFGDAFKVGDMIKIIMKDIGGYFVIMLVLWGISIVVSSVSGTIGVIPVLGWIASYYLIWLTSVGIGVIMISAYSEYYLKHENAL